jgi:uncharacterized protein YgiB involved in biofilm formation
MKFAATAAILLSGVALLVSCGKKEEVEAAVYESPAACADARNASDTLKGVSGSAEKNRSDCESEWQTAKAEQQRSAPAYNSMSDCLSEFKTGCEPTTAHHSTGSGHFMPLMTGYMLGSMRSGSGYNMPTQPAYFSQSKSGFVNSNGSVLSKAFGRTRIDTSSDAFRPAPARSTTLSRGGFGRGEATPYVPQRSASPSAPGAAPAKPKSGAGGWFSKPFKSSGTRSFGRSGFGGRSFGG